MSESGGSPEEESKYGMSNAEFHNRLTAIKDKKPWNEVKSLGDLELDRKLAINSVKTTESRVVVSKGGSTENHNVQENEGPVLANNSTAETTSK